MLKVGSFYWVVITLDPDAEDWENELMPARFVGYVDNEPTWHFLNSEGVSDWPVRWIGEEIIPPIM